MMCVWQSHAFEGTAKVTGVMVGLAKSAVPAASDFMAARRVIEDIG
jgi:hypothetical protein